ncbi:hypothetical protein FRB97_009338 [Tulasnella sp. 331]|nr:hypothetical protein FRB97_009338 [Tulasnella sp. 331]KAG8873058.1 hypothetical protein FRB98_009213 [Tulasnella sp. 332]
MVVRLCQTSSYGVANIRARSRTLPITPITPRYRYYSTPVIPLRNGSFGRPPGGNSHFQQRRAHAAAQLIEPTQSLPDATIRAPGSSQSRAPVFSLSSRGNNEQEDMEEAFASAVIDSVGSDSAWTRKQTGSAKLRKPCMRGLAEQPWLQPNDDRDPGSKEPFPDQESRRFDWRKRALSRLAKSAIPARPRRTKPLLRKFSSGEPDDDAIQAHRDKYKPLILQEQLAADAVLEERLTKWPIKKLQEEGYAILDLMAFWSSHNHFGRPVAVFSLGPGINLPPVHRFEIGNQVRMMSDVEDPFILEQMPEEPLTGSVLQVSQTQIKVSFDERFPLEGSWRSVSGAIFRVLLEDRMVDAKALTFRMDMWSSDIAAQRMIAAVDLMNSDLDEQEAKSYPGHEIVLQGTRLRDELLSSFRHAPRDDLEEGQEEERNDGEEGTEAPFDRTGAFAKNQMIQSWAARYQKSDPLVMEGDPIIDLNESQIRAMAIMIGNGLSLVQGPPGTGKTKIIIEAVRLLKVHFQVPHPILVCTYTNVAVDNLVEAFAATGVKALRVGSPGRIRDSLAIHSLEAKMDAHPLKPKVDKLEKEIGKLKKQIMDAEEEKEAEVTPMAKKLLDAKIGKLRSQQMAKRDVLWELKLDMLHEILWSSDVICTTCLTAASFALNVIDFPVVFLDEASMCTEPASLVAIMKGSEHIALIGDHKQLPPIITSPEALEGGLGVSLFERLITEGRVPTIMLDQQYRMHPTISAFPNKEFYQEAIQDGTINKETGLALATLNPPESAHLGLPTETSVAPSIVFLDHSYPESRKDKSRVNRGEAEMVCAIVADLLARNPDLRCESIGVIAPYAAQITLVRRLFRDDPDCQSRLTSTLGAHRALSTSLIEVKTVDGFEGREKDVIIFSTVRNNPSGYIGFLADRRRLNVGLTRAKRALFVIGNERTLRLGKVGYVEGKGEAVAGDGAGARNVKVDFGVDVAGKAAMVTSPSAVGEGAATPGIHPSVEPPMGTVKKKVVAKTKNAEGVVWRRYLDWLKDQDLIVHVKSDTTS